MPQSWTYILSSRSGVLYVGITNDLERRIEQHKQKKFPGFTAKYNVDRLVWSERFPTALQAIAAEKRIKGWTRAKKIALIEAKNPTWRDLSEEWRVATPTPIPTPAPAGTTPSVTPSRGPSLRSG